jgi:hypothetical protein
MGGLLQLHRTTGKTRDPNPRPMFALIASHAGFLVALTLESRPKSESLRSVDVGFSLKILYYPGGNILFASALILPMKIF